MTLRYFFTSLTVLATVLLGLFMGCSLAQSLMAYGLGPVTATGVGGLFTLVFTVLALSLVFVAFGAAKGPPRIRPPAAMAFFHDYTARLFRELCERPELTLAAWELETMLLISEEDCRLYLDAWAKLQVITTITEDGEGTLHYTFATPDRAVWRGKISHTVSDPHREG